VLKDLGNAAVHVDGSDVNKQDTEFRKLVTGVVITCSEILELIYERQNRAQSRLAALKAAHAAITSP